MKPEMCMICNDVHKVQIMEAEVRGMVCRIRRLLSSKSISIDSRIANEFCRKYRLQLLYDNKHPHFMCGHCHRAEGTLSLLNISEHELKEVLEIVTYYLYTSEDKEKEIKGTVLTELAGHYPMSYKTIERAAPKTI